MSPSPSPTWYDVLGVSGDASAAEIKRAWREATDRFEPGSASGQFRMYNEAADVLLDPRRREEYDASLSVTTGGERQPGAQTSPAAAGLEKRSGEPEPAVQEHEAPGSEPEDREPPDAGPDPTSDTDQAKAAAPRRMVWLTVALAVLTVLALVVVGWLALKVRTDAQIADARTEAPAAAEQAAKAMLSYDYRTLPADRDRASAHLTADYRKKYLQTFRVLEKNKDGSPGAAVQTKTVVAASVAGSGIVDVEADKARVLVFVNQTSRKQGADPQVFQNRVTMTMVKRGDRWLVGNLKSY